MSWSKRIKAHEACDGSGGMKTLEPSQGGCAPGASQ